jgi:transposase
MARPPKEALRALTPEERTQLEALARSRSAPAERIARARELLALAQGATFTQAAMLAGRACRQAVARLVRRFNTEGMSAVSGHHGGGPPLQYGPQQKERILHEFRRSPDREQDGTATWSLTTLQRALRRAPDGLPSVSTYVILQVLHEAGYSWQRSRSWCETGIVQRVRKDGVVTVQDPDADLKRG